MSEAPQVDAKDYKVDIRLMGAAGSESQVYEGENDGKPVAFKIYRGFSVEQLLHYQEVTNSLAKRHNGENVEMTIKGKEYKLSLYIVPIDQVVTTHSNPLDKNEVSPATVTPFIEGDTLFDLDMHYMSNRPVPSLDDPLVKLTTTFRRETGIAKMSVIPWNVKPLLDQDPPVLAVTDVAGIVKEI